MGVSAEKPFSGWGGTELGRSLSSGSITSSTEQHRWLWFSFLPARCCEDLLVEAKGQNEQLARVGASVGLL